MVQEASIANAQGYCSTDVVTRQRDLMQRAGLPAHLPPVKFPELWSAMQHDKKVTLGQIYCVFPREIGQVEVLPLERQVFKSWFYGSRSQSSKNPVKREA
jgi:3-dehydroquinate synthetase